MVLNVTGTGAIIVNASNITNGANGASNYRFVSEWGSNFTMVDSYIENCGSTDVDTYRGLEIFTNDSYVFNTTFQNNYIHLTLHDSYNGTVINNSFYAADSCYQVYDFNTNLSNWSDNYHVSDCTLIYVWQSVNGSMSNINASQYAGDSTIAIQETHNWTLRNITAGNSDSSTVYIDVSNHTVIEDCNFSIDTNAAVKGALVIWDSNFTIVNRTYIYGSDSDALRNVQGSWGGIVQDSYLGTGDGFKVVDVDTMNAGEQ
jgi:hypothetical protein